MKTRIRERIALLGEDRAALTYRDLTVDNEQQGCTGGCRHMDKPVGRYS